MHTNKVNKIQGLIKYGILITGILFIYTGVHRNELGIVLRKAINICSECIGIG